jgi:hypothetical protein
MEKMNRMDPFQVSVMDRNGSLPGYLLRVPSLVRWVL